MVKNIHAALKVQQMEIIGMNSNRIGILRENESEEIIMFGICLLIFIGLCIYHACEKELPADYHNNWRLEAHDSQLVREGKMTKRQFLKNMDNGKYR